jgi:hypothetical protein
VFTRVQAEIQGHFAFVAVHAYLIVSIGTARVSQD